MYNCQLSEMPVFIENKCSFSFRQLKITIYFCKKIQHETYTY